MFYFVSPMYGVFLQTGWAATPPTAGWGAFSDLSEQDQSRKCLPQAGGDTKHATNTHKQCPHVSCSTNLLTFMLQISDANKAASCIWLVCSSRDHFFVNYMFFKQSFLFYLSVNSLEMRSRIISRTAYSSKNDPFVMSQRVMLATGPQGPCQVCTVRWKLQTQG